MEKNYSFLTAAFNPTKTKAMVDKKWDEITQSINSLGKNSSLLKAVNHPANSGGLQ